MDVLTWRDEGEEGDCERQNSVEMEDDLKLVLWMDSAQWGWPFPAIELDSTKYSLAVE